ncbi:MAG: peptidase S41, partial [Cyanobacteria bacterium P01_C01_bin.70]
MQQLSRIPYDRFLIIASASALILLVGVVAAPILPSIGQSHSGIFEQVWQTVNDDFYDPNFNGVSWTDIKARYEPLANQAQSQAEFAQIVNQMLDELNVSHTHFYIPEDPAYYQLAGIFLTVIPETR